MRPAAKIRHWQSEAEMLAWVQEAPDKQTYCRRMAVWLTRTGQMHAHKVANMLGVSKQAVWLWVRQYNQRGPKGLDRQGRGGARRAVLDEKEAKRLVEQLRRSRRAGPTPTGRQIQSFLTESLGRKVSLSYAYGFLRDYERAERGLSRGHGEFRKLAQPWQQHL